MQKLTVGNPCTVLLNQYPSGRSEVQGTIAKVNHATILVRFPDGQYLNRKIKRDLVTSITSP